ncbi:MAG: DUF1573 domain-containing protein [Flavobacteriales bacterium]|nr:DUF1573 domain-containing protein [Flavobacteriales bacterium]
MKKRILSLSMVVSFVFAGAQTIDFESKVIDYGVIEHNSDGNRVYNFTNNGDQPLIIKAAKGSCGCTVPNYKKEDGSSEWAPGESGEVKVKYATNRIGKFTKTITLTTNTPDKKPVILTIKGEVKAPEKETGAPTKDNSGSPLEKK